MCPMELSLRQALALQRYHQGKSILVTGPGGSGKTELIRRIVSTSGPKRVQVCALTGCAAVLLQCKAKTLHSFAGIGLANGTEDDLVRRAMASGRTQLWSAIDVLVVDEVSMMSSKLFATLDQIARRARRRLNVPFGGLQLVFSGDFYQLPPVEPNASFCFEHPHWDQTFDEVIALTTIFRQVDAPYRSILNQIRVGALSDDACATLRTRLEAPVPTHPFKPTMICPRRDDAERLNARELHALPGDEHVFQLQKVRLSQRAPKGGGEGSTRGYSDEQVESEWERLFRTVMVDVQLALKRGAQVMVVANLDVAHQVVNGSQGTVVDFVDGRPLVRFTDGHTRLIEPHQWRSDVIPCVALRQLPLIHAWAITIHKAQGISLDMAQIDAGRSNFECGQIYVALSRVRSLDGLYLTDLDPGKIRANPKVVAYYDAHVPPDESELT